MAAPSVSVSSVDIALSSYSGDVIDIAKAYLEGETEDYYFFQYDDSVYVLLIGDLLDSDGAVYSDSCTVVVIWREEEEGESSVSMNYSGSFSGSFAGFQERGIVHGDSSGTSDLVYTSVNYSYFTASSAVVDVAVYNPENHLVFSSFSGYPHLIEGVQNYAYAAFMLTVGVIVYRLADRLFRRVY